MKCVNVYEGLDDLNKLRATDLNANNPPEDLVTRPKYRIVLHMDVALVSPESQLVVRARLGNKG